MGWLMTVRQLALPTELRLGLGRCSQCELCRCRRRFAAYLAGRLGEHLFHDRHGKLRWQPHNQSLAVREYHGLVCRIFLFVRGGPVERGARRFDGSGCTLRSCCYRPSASTAGSHPFILPIIVLSQLDINSPVRNPFGSHPARASPMPILVDVLLFRDCRAGRGLRTGVAYFADEYPMYCSLSSLLRCSLISVLLLCPTRLADWVGMTRRENG